MTLPLPETTTLHRVVKEEATAEKFTIICEAEVSRLELNSLIQGYKVEGLGLCAPVGSNSCND